ncbi:MAG: hypothetical protein JZU53_07115 [Paludibacter sp.]|nr:hypothetical protein [Paludibacter sp.]
MEKNKKLDFTHIPYQKVICWGHGNNAVGLQQLASIRLCEPTEKEIEAKRIDYNEAKEIYEKYINKGQKFQGSNKDIVAKITHINFEKFTVNYKQCNIDEYTEKHGLFNGRPWKPAKGKFSINAMISLIRTKEIKIYE